MTTREKDLRIKIGSECLYKGWRSDYLTSCWEKYDFIRCPDDFEYVKDYTNGFVGLCNTDEENNSCEQCWKNFLNGGNDE